MSGDLPAGACDMHCHVFGPASDFPFDPDRTYTPKDAPKEALFTLHDRLGIDRALIVQPAAHGFDHRALLDAIAARSDRYRGVALLPETVSSREIRRLHADGIRAVRFNFIRRLSEPPSRKVFQRIVAMVAPYGWHIALHLLPADIDGIGDYVRDIQTPFVVDHMGRIDAAQGMDQAGFLSLLKLLESPLAWVKISGADRASAAGPPYRDTERYMRRLIETAPDRVIWGADWPHPNIKGEIPDEYLLLKLLREAAGDLGALTRILVENPKTLVSWGELT